MAKYRILKDHDKLLGYKYIPQVCDDGEWRNIGNLRHMGDDMARDVISAHKEKNLMNGKYSVVWDDDPKPKVMKWWQKLFSALEGQER